MGAFSSLELSGTGLTAQRTRIDVIMSNLANASTTRTPEGTPYRRKDVILSSDRGADFKGALEGVTVTGIVEDKENFIRKYEPNHPDADPNGYVLYPNVDAVEEMTNLMSAVRCYEANVTSMNAVKEMMMKALEIGR